MRKYLEVYFNSLKQSVFHKPVALVMFVLMIVVATVACGFSSRLMIGEAEQEIYPYAANITCEQNADRIAIGDYMRSIRDEYFDDYKSHGVILAQALDAVAIFNGKIADIDVVDINFEVFPDKFSDISIESGQNVMYANNVFCDLLGCGYGDRVVFLGTEFLISGVENSNYYETIGIISLPYTVELADLDMNSADEESVLRINYLEFNGLKKNLTKPIYEDLKSIGVKRGKEYVSFSLVQGVLMLIAFLAASSLSVVSVTNYWQSVNERKYNIYKIIGASPKTLMGIMLFETGAVAAIAVAIGTLVDYAISLVVNIGSIGRLLWLHYLILFIATLLAVMVMVTLKTRKIANRLPMQQSAEPKKKEKRV